MWDCLCNGLHRQGYVLVHTYLPCSVGVRAASRNTWFNHIYSIWAVTRHSTERRSTSASSDNRRKCCVVAGLSWLIHCELSVSIRSNGSVSLSSACVCNQLDISIAEFSTQMDVHSFVRPNCPCAVGNIFLSLDNVSFYTNFWAVGWYAQSGLYNWTDGSIFHISRWQLFGTNNFLVASGNLIKSLINYWCFVVVSIGGPFAKP